MKHFCSFSEAIREGAKLRPQTTVNLFDSEGTCAIGAGLHAIYGDRMLNEDGHPAFEFDVIVTYPYMSNKILHCPHRAAMRWWQFWKWDICVWGERPHSLIDSIGHLNDTHGWTREQVADWLESEEEKLGYVTISEDMSAVQFSAPAVTAEVCGAGLST